MLLVSACVLIAYLVGAIPFGLLVGFSRGVDIRKQGSGNIGATNVGRVLGRPYGYLAFGLDVLKGFGPTFAAGVLISRAGALSGASYLLAVVAVAAATILGHVFPVYLGFRGGKGVATSLGALLGVYPYFTLTGVIALALWVLLTLTTRYVSVGSVGAAVAFPVIFALAAHQRGDSWGGLEKLWPLYVFSIAMALLVIVRHRGNLKRLRQGTEAQIGGPSSRSSAGTLSK